MANSKLCLTYPGEEKSVDLKNAVVVVTGAARGVGRAIASAFAADGAQVAMVDLLADPLRQSADELTNEGGQAQPFVADITKPDQVAEMAKQVDDRFGRVDVLVNCAGTFSVIGPVWEIDPELWFRDIQVNLFGSFLVCNALVGQMVEAGSGYVLNVVSTGGVGDPHPHCTSYASSKTGLMRLTEGLAAETAESGIKVFAVAPPAVMTDMTRFILNDPGGRRWRPNFARFFEEGKDYPPEAVADLAIALTTGRADALSGRYFDVRDDLEKMIAAADEIVEKDQYTLRIRRP